MTLPGQLCSDRLSTKPISDVELDKRYTESYSHYFRISGHSERGHIVFTARLLGGVPKRPLAEVVDHAKQIMK